MKGNSTPANPCSAGWMWAELVYCAVCHGFVSILLLKSCFLCICSAFEQGSIQGKAYPDCMCLQVEFQLHFLHSFCSICSRCSIHASLASLLPAGCVKHCWPTKSYNWMRLLCCVQFLRRFNAAVQQLALFGSKLVIGKVCLKQLEVFSNQLLPNLDD